MIEEFKQGTAEMTHLVVKNTLLQAEDPGFQFQALTSDWSQAPVTVVSRDLMLSSGRLRFL